MMALTASPSAPPPSPSPTAATSPTSAGMLTPPKRVPNQVIYFTTRNSPEPHLNLPSVPPLSAFLAGALAGAASRTVVSPLERLKILLQIQPKNGEYKGMIPSLMKIYREEGWAGYMRGNGVNVLRIAPYSAVQFSSYELFKNVLCSNGAEIDTPRRLIAGSLAGICSVVTTYPLDLVRSRLSILSASIGNGEIVSAADSTIVGMTLKVFREEGGFKGLYRGMMPTAAGVAPYVSLNFAIYEGGKSYLTSADGEQPSTFQKLMCGGISGGISQTCTYPLDLVRRRLQVCAIPSMNYNYTGGIDCLTQVVKKEGFGGLYKGIIPNLIKVAPSMSVSFAVYEAAREFLDTRTEESSH